MVIQRMSGDIEKLDFELILELEVLAWLACSSSPGLLCDFVHLNTVVVICLSLRIFCFRVFCNIYWKYPNLPKAIADNCLVNDPYAMIKECIKEVKEQQCSYEASKSNHII